jgi:lysophospholipase L1-like esterase
MYKSGFRWLLSIIFVFGLFVMSVSPASAAGLKNESAMPLAATGDGSPGDSNIKYIGRWDTGDLSNVKSYWSGAYFRVNFTGTTLSIKLGAAVPIYVTIDSTTTYYSGANGTVNLTPSPLASGTHTLRVAARSEYDTIQFKGLVLSSGASTQAPAAKGKLIEFIGDSITAGCCTLTNWALSDYAWLTGEAVNADHIQVAYSGICLQNAANCGENNIGMSVQFFKLQTIHYTNSPAWDFNRYQPNQVVINLGTNDWNTPDATLQSTYVTFLQNVRAKYPNADIFVLRTFGGYKAALTQAAVNARISAGDTKVRYVDTTGWVTTGDFDSDNLHPTMNGHIKIANRLQSILGTTTVPTSTPTRIPTATPTRTPTQVTGPTNTPLPGASSTRTPTQVTGPTNTPLPGASSTRTPTQVTGPTNTPLPGASPTRTPTPNAGPTATPTQGTGSTCSPVTATITAPFTQDGAGAFCWQSSNLGAYINSWNLVSLTVNGVNETNLYVASGSYPAKINGYWYVSYNSTVSWGHFEAK